MVDDAGRCVLRMSVRTMALTITQVVGVRIRPQFQSAGLLRNSLGIIDDVRRPF